MPQLLLILPALFLLAYVLLQLSTKPVSIPPRPVRVPPPNLSPASVSVVIPIFNTAKYVSRAIDSALGQTRPPLEIIVVDDASTDELAAALAPYGDKIRVLAHAQNAGLSATRNTGVAAATGDVLAFLDADDWWPPDFLARVVPHVHPGFAVCYDNITVNESTLLRPDGSVIPWSPGDELPAGPRLLDEWRAAGGPDQLSVRNLPVIFDTPSLFKIVVNRLDSLRAGNFDPRYFGIEDFHYFVKLLASNVVLQVLPDPVGLYMVRGDSILRTIEKSSQKNLDGLKAKWHLFDEMPNEIELPSAAIDRCNTMARYFRARYADALFKAAVRKRELRNLSLAKTVIPAVPGIALFKARGLAAKVRGTSNSTLGHMLQTVMSSVGVLAINFVTGILVARQLAPEGRGVISVIGTWTQIIGWASAMGFYEAVTYMRAKNEFPPRRILASALLVAALFGTIGVVGARLAIPHFFTNATPAEATLAKAWMYTIYLSVAGTMLNAMITGNHQFGLLNLLRLLQPLAYLFGLLVLLLLHHFTPLGVLSIQTGTEALISGYLFFMLVRTVGIGLPAFSILRQGLGYGVRVQGALFAALANGRLDIMILGAFVLEKFVGMYSVATNLSGLIVAMLGSLALVVFPTATQKGAVDGLRLVGRSLRFVTYAGAAAALGMFLFCPMLIHYFYGAKFDGTAAPLRLLLPGALAMAATKIVDGGLQAVNQPFKATYAQVYGLVITIVGLYFTIKPMGINGAALTSTLSYTASFAVSLLFLARHPSFNLSEAFSLRLFFHDCRLILSKFGFAAAPPALPVPPPPSAFEVVFPAQPEGVR